MKKYLTFIFIGLSIFCMFFIYTIDVFWSGIAASLMASICLICALYFSRYIKK